MTRADFNLNWQFGRLCLLFSEVLYTVCSLFAFFFMFASLESQDTLMERFLENLIFIPSKDLPVQVDVSFRAVHINIILNYKHARKNDSCLEYDLMNFI